MKPVRRRLHTVLGFSVANRGANVVGAAHQVAPPAAASPEHLAPTPASSPSTSVRRLVLGEHDEDPDHAITPVLRARNPAGLGRRVVGDPAAPRKR
jgi:hypothetical protein